MSRNVSFFIVFVCTIFFLQQAQPVPNYDFKIPKKIHVIRFGTPLTGLFLSWHETWKVHHVDWEIILWNEELIKKEFPEGLINKKIYHEAQAMSDYATMSKIVRYEILYKFGGLFVDFDRVCFKSFDFLHKQYDFYAGLGQARDVDNSVIGSRAYHPVLKACLEIIKNSDCSLPGDWCSVGNWMMRHLSNAPLTCAVLDHFVKHDFRNAIFNPIIFDGNQVIRRLHHTDQVIGTNAHSYVTNDQFCAKGVYSYVDDQREFDPFFPLSDATSVDFIKKDYPKEEKPFLVVIASYNNQQWYKRNLTSVFMQHYHNYHVIYVDDASTDGTGVLVEQFIKEHRLENRVTLIKNRERMGAAANYYKVAHLCQDQAILVHLDGDDWLAHEHVFEVLNKTYHDSQVWMTYGQFLSYPDFDVSSCKPFPKEVIAANAFRQYPHWISSHLRSCYIWLFKLIKSGSLQFRGNFLQVAWDLAEMFSLMEMAGEHTRFIPHLLYIHNKANPLGDVKINRPLQRKMDFFIRKQSPYKSLQLKA